ncbi:APC family permease, partial [Lacticaseibacillus rhamnosus]
LPFPSWNKLVGVVTSASVMMYAGAPLALGALRKAKPDLPRPYRLPAAHILAPLSFVLATFIVYWAGWSTYTTLMVALLIGYALMVISAAFHLNPNQPRVDWGAGRSGGPEVAGRRVFPEVLAPPPHLVVCGGGDDARPLVADAAGAGLPVRLFGSRPAAVGPGWFPPGGRGGGGAPPGPPG